MISLVRPFFYGWLLLPALMAVAQETPPSPTALTTEPAPVTQPATPAASATVATEAPRDRVVSPVTTIEEAPLRRLDVESPTAAEVEVKTSPPTPLKKPVRRRHGNDDRVAVLNDAHVEAQENINGDAVAVLGDLSIDGEVQGDAVAVLGDLVINGTVHGDVVNVLGDLTLGPKAHIDGKIIAVGGDVHKDPGAFVGGKIVKEAVGKNFHVGLPLQSWWTHALKIGRPLAFGAGLTWLWIATAAALGFYALMALLFPEGLRRTGDLLVQRPVAVILSSMLTLLALPVLFVLLLVTIVGIPVALLVLPVGVILSLLFGKAAIYGLVGRRISGDSLQPAIAVLAGGMLFVLIYLVPVVGLIVSLLVSLLGFGCSITAILTSRKKIGSSASPFPPAPASIARGEFNPATTTPPPSAGLSRDESSAAPSGFVASSPTFGWPAEPTADIRPSAGLGVPPTSPSASSIPSSVRSALAAVSPTAPNATLQRAGFWIRTGALLIDLILVGAVFLPTGAGGMVFIFLAAYAATMWALKGTTIGGIVCGLRVVRLDDRAIDWPTAIVRALGCFLSLVVGGLGFVWVVFDDERQSWHDKIAGTVVVLAPKGTSLV